LFGVEKGFLIWPKNRPVPGLARNLVPRSGNHHCPRSGPEKTRLNFSPRTGRFLG